MLGLNTGKVHPFQQLCYLITHFPWIGKVGTLLPEVRWTRSISLQNISQWTNDPDTQTIADLEEGTHSRLFFYLIFLMTKCLSETNGFIFLNPGNNMGSLYGSGPLGFRQLTKHILLLLCCPSTMLFTYRRMSASLRLIDKVAWVSYIYPLHRNRRKPTKVWKGLLLNM